jgi:DNA-directed RNA polymerase specialized sigma subunit
MLREVLQNPRRDLRRELDIPSRDTLVAAALRQMARDLRAHEAARKRHADEVIDRTTAILRKRLGRCPTPEEVARTGGIDVEDVLDEISRRRNDRPLRT